MYNLLSVQIQQGQSFWVAALFGIKVNKIFPKSNEIQTKWVHDKFPLNHDTSKYLSSNLTDYTD